MQNKWNNWFGNFLCALIMSLYTNLSYLNIKSCRNVNLFNYSENKIHTPSVSQYHIITHIFIFQWKISMFSISASGYRLIKCKSVRETRSWTWGGGGGFPVKRVLFTLHHDYRKKNQNCKNRQWWHFWCLLLIWRFMCPLSMAIGMHQFIEISICALGEKKSSNTSMSSDPWKSVR